jgi:hypothetical protein
MVFQKRRALGCGRSPHRRAERFCKRDYFVPTVSSRDGGAANQYRRRRLRQDLGEFRQAFTIGRNSRTDRPHHGWAFAKAFPNVAQSLQPVVTETRAPTLVRPTNVASTGLSSILSALRLRCFSPEPGMHSQ